MEHTELSTEVADNTVVRDDNGNFKEESGCVSTEENDVDDKIIPDSADPLSIDTEKTSDMESPLKKKDIAESNEDISKMEILVKTDEDAEENSKREEKEESNTVSVGCASSPDKPDTNIINGTSGETYEKDSLDADLELVVAEATKLQSEVLQSIIGSKAKYIPRSIESSEDNQVNCLEEKTKDDGKDKVFTSEVNSLIMKTEAIHIEMNIKDNIEEITIEDDGKAEEREIDCDSEKSQIPEERLAESEEIVKITTESEGNADIKKQEDCTNEALILSDSINETVESVTGISLENDQTIDPDETNNIVNEDKIADELISEENSSETENMVSAGKNNLEDTGEQSKDKQPNEDKDEIDSGENVVITNEDEIKNIITIGETEGTQIEDYSGSQTIIRDEKGTEDYEVVIENNQMENDGNSDDISQKSVELSFEDEEVCDKTETIGESLSQTPDLVKVCDTENHSSNEQSGEARNELQQSDDSITPADKQCQAVEGNTLEEENIDSEKTSFQALDLETDDSISKEMIVDLISGSGENTVDGEDKTILKEATTAPKQKAKVHSSEAIKNKTLTSTQMSKTKSEKQKIVKNAVKKKSTVIAGQKVDLNSDKAQYLHLTLEQIQDLAMKQRSGELFTEEKPSEHKEDTHCAVHSSLGRKTSKKGVKASSIQPSSKTQKSEQKNDEGISTTITSEGNESLQSPDVIKEAEATSIVSRSNIKKSVKEDNNKDLVPPQRVNRAKSLVRKNPGSENQVSKRSESVGRPDLEKKRQTSNDVKRSNTKVRERTVKKQEMLFESDGNSERLNKQKSNTEVRKSSIQRDGSSKGGLLAPTQSWLSRIGDRKEIKSRSPSPGPKEVKRSFSAPRKLIDRSPSPKRRIRVTSKETEENIKKTKENQKLQPSPRPPRRSSSIRSSPDPNVSIKRSGSIKKVPTMGNQNENLKPISNKPRKDGKTEKSTMSNNNETSKALNTQITKESQATTSEEKVLESNVSESIPNTSLTVNKTEADQSEMNTVTKTEEQSSTYTVESDIKTETTMQSSNQTSCIEESSITATEVIEMFESENKTENKEVSVKHNNQEEKSVKDKTNGIKVEIVKPHRNNRGHTNATKPSENSKSLNKSVASQLPNGSGIAVTKNNGSSNADVKKIRDKTIKSGTTNKESTKNKTSTSSNKITKSAVISEELNTEKKISENMTKSSEACVTKTHKSNSSNTTFVKDSNNSMTNGTTKAKVEAKPRTTMIIRLHPGNSKRISAYLEHQPEDPSSGSGNLLNWTEDVKYEDTPGAICGLEISFSSVPQDVDIKLISAGEQGEGYGRGKEK